MEDQVQANIREESGDPSERAGVRTWIITFKSGQKIQFKAQGNAPSNGNHLNDLVTAHRNRTKSTDVHTYAGADSTGNGSQALLTVCPMDVESILQVFD